MMRGHCTAKIDSKGRLKVPAEFLGELIRLCGESRRVFITSHDGKQVQVFPLPVWQEHEETIGLLEYTDLIADKYLRVINYWGREASIDNQGRVLIHPLLRDSARLDGEVCVFGKQKILEVCDHAQYRRDPPSMTREEMDSITKTLRKKKAGMTDTEDE